MHARSFTPLSEMISLSALKAQLDRAQADIAKLESGKASASDHRELKESFKSFVDLEKVRDEADEKAKAERAKRFGDRVWQIVAGVLLVLLGAAVKSGWDWLVSTKPQNPPVRTDDERHR